MRPIWISLCAGLVLLASPAIADAISGTLETGVDRAGGDYETFALDGTDPNLCFSACGRDEQCLAWTYVKPGVDGDQAQCRLKDSVPAGLADNCCTSGIMDRAGVKATNTVAQSGEPHPWDTVRQDGRWCAVDIMAAGYKPVFTQISPAREDIFVFTDPQQNGYIGLADCDRVSWNWIAFHATWIEQSISHPSAEEDPIYTKIIDYRHAGTGELVTIAYFR